MLTQLNIIQDPRGYTVSVSTTHQTHAGALAHFTELLAQFTRDHQQATARRAAQTAAAAGDIVPTKATGPCLVATTAEANERAAPAPAPLFQFAPPGSHSPGGEEPPF
jgi:hypothetical protein